MTQLLSNILNSFGKLNVKEIRCYFTSFFSVRYQEKYAKNPRLATMLVRWAIDMDEITLLYSVIRGVMICVMGWSLHYMGFYLFFLT